MYILKKKMAEHIFLQNHGKINIKKLSSASHDGPAYLSLFFFTVVARPIIFPGSPTLLSGRRSTRLAASIAGRRMQWLDAGFRPPR
jgi:hypothetical protein